VTLHLRPLWLSPPPAPPRAADLPMMTQGDMLRIISVTRRVGDAVITKEFSTWDEAEAWRESVSAYLP
jgi:hypothetical protein